LLDCICGLLVSAKAQLQGTCGAPSSLSTRTILFLGNGERRRTRLYSSAV
jgi:hypothetical protein